MISFQEIDKPATDGDLDHNDSEKRVDSNNISQVYQAMTPLHFGDLGKQLDSYNPLSGYRATPLCCANSGTVIVLLSTSQGWGHRFYYLADEWTK